MALSQEDDQKHSEPTAPGPIRLCSQHTDHSSETIPCSSHPKPDTESGGFKLISAGRNFSKGCFLSLITPSVLTCAMLKTKRELDSLNLKLGDFTFNSASLGETILSGNPGTSYLQSNNPEK